MTTQRPLLLKAFTTYTSQEAGALMQGHVGSTRVRVLLVRGQKQGPGESPGHSLYWGLHWEGTAGQGNQLGLAGWVTELQEQSLAPGTRCWVLQGRGNIGWCACY